ncbi:MAG TPA: NADPH:quinone reductase [Verrucomicrobiae bacterium]|jgi:NADPH2:quinone reductase|nr:NADPH:quinone reductase [Verrucomicrobiae bacterium]
MKAIRVHEFGVPENMKLEEAPDLKPGAGQVLVKVQAAGVNPVDTYIRAGTYPVKPALPFTPGFDAAGVVEAVGEGVRKFKKGDRVYTTATVTGAYASLAVCPESGVHPLPETLSFPQGAAIGIPYATAWHALFHKAQATAGETVLVHGASGGVGVAAVQIARAAGMTVIGTAGTPEGRKLVLGEGAHHALDHRNPAYLDEIKKITDGHGVSVILEMLANVNLPKDLGLLGFRGRVVVIGCRGDVEINPRLLMARDSSVTGMLIFNATPEEKKKIHADLFEGFKSGRLRPVVGRELPLKDAARAHHDVMESPAHGKIVLIP